MGRWRAFPRNDRSIQEFSRKNRPNNGQTIRDRSSEMQLDGMEGNGRMACRLQDRTESSEHTGPGLGGELPLRAKARTGQEGSGPWTRGVKRERQIIIRDIFGRMMDRQMVTGHQKSWLDGMKMKVSCTVCLVGKINLSIHYAMHLRPVIYYQFAYICYGNFLKILQKTPPCIKKCNTSPV